MTEMNKTEYGFKRFINLTVVVFAIVLVLLLSFAGCANQEVEEKESTSNNEDEQREQNDEKEKQNDNDEFSELPETITEMVMIEGMEEEMELQLFRSSEVVENEADHGLITYYPVDMKMDNESVDESNKFMFYANFQDQPEYRAQVSLLLFHEQYNLDDLDLEDVAEKLEIKLEEVGDEYAPSLSNSSLQLSDYGIYFTQELSGSLYLGNISDRVIAIHISYPHEFGDGMATRSNVILEKIDWR